MELSLKHEKKSFTFTFTKGINKMIEGRVDT